MEQDNQPKPRLFFITPSMKVWLLVSLNFACVGIFSLLTKIDSLAWISAGPDDGYPSWMGKLAAALYSIVVFLLPALIFANALSVYRFGFFKLQNRVNAVPVILSVLALVASIFFIDFIYVWNKTLVTDPEIIKLEQESTVYTSWLLQMPGIGDLLICLLANALVPAIAEELFFRGSLQQLVSEWIKKPLIAVLLTAAFFSLLHFEMSGFLARFVLGALLGLLFYWSGSLRLSIFAHFTFNATTIIDEYISQHYPESGWAQLETGPALALVSAAVSVGAMLTCYRLLSRKKMA